MGLLLTTKILSGVILGFIISVIIYSLTQIGTLSIVFIILSTTLAFLRIVWHYKFMRLICTNLLFISLFLLLKLYIYIATTL